MRFLVGKRFAGALVGLVGGQPDLVADRQFVVVQRKDVADSLAGVEEAVDLVIAQAHDGAEQTQTGPVLVAQRAERRAGFELIHVEDAVFDVERRIDIVHLELRLRSREFRLESAQDRVRGSRRREAPFACAPDHGSGRREQSKDRGGVLQRGDARGRCSSRTLPPALPSRRP